ncbi:hypothetical protein GQX74_004228 [Glossina fuscipes]|nr:hypothetical protein GQX74_004228 [Glossina fuscipes]
MRRQLGRHRMVVALNFCRVKVFDLVDQELVQGYQARSEPVNDLAFHPSGNFMLTGSEDETVNVLDLLNGRSMYTRTGHTGCVIAVAFNYKRFRYACAEAD